MSQTNVSYEEKEYISSLINKWNNIATTWRTHSYDILIINKILGEIENLHLDMLKIYKVCINTPFSLFSSNLKMFQI